VGWILGFAVAASVAGHAVSDEQVAHWAKSKGGDEHALTFLVRGKWTELEAGERGVKVSDETVRHAADPPGDGLTTQDSRYEAKLILLEAGIHDQITEPAAKSVTPEQVDAYVDAHPKFLPDARRVRMVRTKTPEQAREAARELRRGEGWKRTARRYAGGGTTTVARNEGRFPRQLEKAIFEAQRNRITRAGVFVFAVTNTIPPRPMNRAQQEAQAWEILSSEAQQRAVDAFNGAFNAKWRGQTSCAANYATAAVCGT
jgi:hypothetical protein